MSYYTIEPGEGYPEAPKNSENEFFGNGWSVKKEAGKYELSWISGELAGRLKTIEITEEDFLSAKDGRLGLNDLLIKYAAS